MKHATTRTMITRRHSMAEPLRHKYATSNSYLSSLHYTAAFNIFLPTYMEAKTSLVLRLPQAGVLKNTEV